jgi:hypothetical protein
MDLLAIRNGLQVSGEISQQSLHIGGLGYMTTQGV